MNWDEHGGFSDFRRPHRQVVSAAPRRRGGAAARLSRQKHQGREGYEGEKNKVLQNVEKKIRLRQLTETQKKDLQKRYGGAKLQEHPRGDFSVMVFWRPHQRAFFDVLVWSHFAVTHPGQSSRVAHLLNAKAKRDEYEARIRVDENGSCCTLLSTTKSTAAAATIAFR